MTTIQSMFAELRSVIETIADPQQLRQLWSGSKHQEISSPAEEIAHVFDDYQIDAILKTDRSVLDVSESEFRALTVFRDSINRYLEHIAPRRLQSIDWREVLDDPYWRDVSSAAKAFTEAARKE